MLIRCVLFVILYLLSPCWSIAQEETAEMIDKLSEQLREVLAANKELRAENERLRHIY